MEHLTRCLLGLLILSTQLAVGTGFGGLVGTCTLLGPEGPDVNPYLWAFSSCCCCGVGGGYRPYFENYTVDASIFDATFFVVS